jgi:hypothetical protein
MRFFNGHCAIGSRIGTLQPTRRRGALLSLWCKLLHHCVSAISAPVQLRLFSPYDCTHTGVQEWPLNLEFGGKGLVDAGSMVRGGECLATPQPRIQELPLVAHVREIMAYVEKESRHWVNTTLERARQVQIRLPCVGSTGGRARKRGGIVRVSPSHRTRTVYVQIIADVGSESE